MPMETLKHGLIEFGRSLHPQPLILAGGYGLYLRHLERSAWPNTLIPPDLWTPARATADLDVMLQPEVVVDPAAMTRVRQILERLGYQVIPTAACMQWRHPVTRIKIDLLAGPLGESESVARRTDDRRVGPRPSVHLHAHDTPEALDYHVRPEPIEVSKDGVACIAYVPRPLTLMLMKLFALRDRAEDPDKDLGQHHALDLYRILAMMTQDEFADCQQTVRTESGTKIIQEARTLIAELFGVTSSADPLGIIRLREALRPLDATKVQAIETFLSALNAILPAASNHDIR